MSTNTNAHRNTGTTDTRAPVAAAPLAARTRAAMVSLVAGAVALALSRTLASAGGSPAQRLAQMHGHDAQATVSALLAVAGFAALVPGFLAVAAHVRGRGAMLATIGSGFVVAGGIGFAVLASVDAPTLAATHVGATSAMEDFLHQLDVSPIILGITPFAVAGYFFGPFLVTLASRRAGFVPAWLPWGVLVSLIVQPVGAGFGGPVIAHLVDAVCQLFLVAMTLVLARCVLAEVS